MSQTSGDTPQQPQAPQPPQPPEPPAPQLVMWRDGLSDLPEDELPAGHTIRHYEPGMAAAWEQVAGTAFGWEKPEGRFAGCIRYYNPFRPERVFFVFKGDAAVATATAWYNPAYGPRTGYLHYVAVHPEHQGKRLGRMVSLAALHKMADEGRTAAVLQTDDFRLPALKTYLGMGFVPRLIDENQRQRWRGILQKIGGEELVRKHKGAVEGPLFQPDHGKVDRAVVENWWLRRKWLPNREHRGGRCGGGDTDVMTDESLYRPSRLGTATLRPGEATAGSEMAEPLRLVYTAGPAGVPEGGAVYFCMRGQTPLGFDPTTQHEDHDGYMKVEAPAHVEFKPMRPLGIRLTKGHLAEGDTVSLTAAKPGGLKWTPLAGRREHKVCVDPGGGEPHVRLPGPLVINITPREAQRIEATNACTYAAGNPIRVHVTARDEFDNRAPIAGEVEVALGEESRIVPMVGGIADAELPSAGAEGPLRAKATLMDRALSCSANPCVPAGEYKLYIGDLHCHDCLSEAEGYTDDVYAWAKDDRNLDFISVVPQSHGWHDNETWTIVKYTNERHLREGRFVTLLGFEWQHTGYGDKVIHYLGGDQPYLPVDDGRYNNAPQLYEALRGSDALIISHHTAYPEEDWCPLTDWGAAETDIERVAELWSMHGSCEGYDTADRPYYQMDPRGYIYEALRRGVRVGFVAGSDTHSARPGGSAKEPRPYWGGLAAVWAKSLTRRDIFEAIYARRTYALTGARIALWMTVNGAPMGSELPHTKKAEIIVSVWGTSPIASVELLKNTKCIHMWKPEEEELHASLTDDTGGAAFYHCRVTQEDGELAVCSPVWVG